MSPAAILPQPVFLRSSTLDSKESYMDDLTLTLEARAMMMQNKAAVFIFI